jgi:hypothetical protein
VPAHVTPVTPLCQTTVDGGGCAEAGYQLRPTLLP